MCTNKAELETTVNEIRKYKLMVEEAQNIQKALEADVIQYLTNNGLTEEITDTAKITYKEQSKENLVKDKVKELLSPADYEKVINTITYSVLRIK